MPQGRRRTPAERALDEAGRMTIAIEALNAKATTLGRDRDRLILFAYEEQDGEVTYPVIAERVGIDRSRVSELLRRARGERGYDEGD